MSIRKIIVPLGIVMGAGLSYWLMIPGLNFLLAIVFAVVMIMLVIERQHAVALAAVISGGIIGLIPGLALTPVSIFVPNWLQLVIPPIAMAWLLNRGFGAGRSFTIAGLCLAVACIMLYQQHSTIFMQVIDQMHSSVTGMINGLMSSKGVDQATMDATADHITQSFFYIKWLMPGILVAFGLTQLFIAFILVEKFYTRRDSYFPGLGPYIYWKIPEKLLYSLALALAVRLVLHGFWQQAADNVLFVLVLLYAVGGLSLIEYMLRKLQLPVYLKIVVYLALVVFQIPGLIMATMIGVFDSYFDYRKVRAHTLG